MSCCPLSVIGPGSCRCVRPPLRHLKVPAPPPPPCTSPCRVVFSTCQPWVYGGHAARPWETLRDRYALEHVRHPFQGGCQGQLLYGPGQSADQGGQLSGWGWLQLGCCWLALHLLLPLLLVCANFTLLRNTRLSTTVVALLFSAYYELISSWLRDAYQARRRLLGQRGEAPQPLSRTLATHALCYNQVTFSLLRPCPTPTQIPLDS